MSLIDRSRNLLGNVRNRVEHAIDKVEDKVSDAAHAVKNTVQAGGRAVGHAVDGFEDKVVSTASTVQHLFGGGDQPDRIFDGAFVGAGGRVLPPTTPLRDVPGVTPRNNPNPSETVIFVNGIGNTKDDQFGAMQQIADTTGARVVGVHNATEGGAADVIQCIKDKLDKGRNPAVDTLADTVYTEIKAGRSVHLFGHSQGGLITSRALQDVYNRLRIEDGMSKGDAQKAMGKINVETFGAAAWSYPDGPKYVHYVNNKDLVPGLFGLGSGSDPTNFAKHAGKDAVIRRFDYGSGVSGTHTLTSAYLPQRVPFDEARAGR
jgi:hypothetical protein